MKDQLAHRVGAVLGYLLLGVCIVVVGGFVVLAAKVVIDVFLWLWGVL